MVDRYGYRLLDGNNIDYNEVQRLMDDVCAEAEELFESKCCANCKNKDSHDDCPVYGIIHDNDTVLKCNSHVFKMKEEAENAR